MLGVIAQEKDHAVIKELFELFKTPWQLYRQGRAYDAVLVLSGPLPEKAQTKLFVVYGSTALPSDHEHGIVARPENTASCKVLGEDTPIYSGWCALQGGSGADREEAIAEIELAESRLIRVGYSLVAEVEHLLSAGQPTSRSLIPTLDSHIDLLRKLLVRSGIALVEISAVPAGYSFSACLTHDIDFVSLKQHRLDHTTFGFLYRATLGSVLDLIRGHRPLSRVLRNWMAVLQAPFVYAGLCEDFWLPFKNYLKIESGRPSTFFIIPQKNCPGRRLAAGDNRRRGTRYDISDVKQWMPLLQQAGCEVALHGINAWNNLSEARGEANRIERFTGDAPKGVRMHWLYFDDRSAEALDRAGFEYDSTCGYNDAIGFKAGTAQVFKPLNSERLLELPMHIQDTALFYPGRMHLKEAQAWSLCLKLIDATEKRGGVLTVLWHDRSLVPERLWGEFYARLLAELDARQVWWATAARVVDWFRARRAVRFVSEEFRETEVEVELGNVAFDSTLPDIKLTVTRLDERGEVRRVEAPVRGRSMIRLTLEPEFDTESNGAEAAALAV